MCGIAGFYHIGINNQEALVLLQNMLNTTAHRGPDFTGTGAFSPAFLGHNRLSIIDLSKEANQPMSAGHLHLTFNGEIYNYLELKKDLVALGYTFKTNSDTEVILQAYAAWGSDCVKKFMGMWAFVIWDETTKTLFCSRDRFGIKPFYYTRPAEGQFYFASEYKPLKKTPGFQNNLNLAQVSRGLQLGWICLADETYFTAIKSLPAAHNLILKNDKVTIEKYWELDFNQHASGNIKEKTTHFKELFSNSIQLHLRSDVPVAASLSGGIDSSSIVSYTLSSNPSLNLQTFSIYYDGENDVDERPFIEEVVLKYRKQIDARYFKPSDKDVQEHFHRALYHCDVPAAGSSFLSQYFVMKLIAENNIKVVLSGQGADDYLGGYMHSFYRHFADLLQKGKFIGLFREFSALRKDQQYSSGKSLDVLIKSVLSGLKRESSLYNFEYKHYFPFVMADETHSIKNSLHLENKGNNKLNAFLYQLCFNSSLPTLLHYEDRNSMAYSIESRVPFLDHRLVEYAFSLNNSDKIKGASTKFILKEAMKPYLPEKIYHRKDKRGFVTPGEVKWLRGSLKHLLEDSFSHIDFLDQQKVKKVMDGFKRGDNKNANLVWRIAVLNYWVKHFQS